MKEREIASKMKAVETGKGVYASILQKLLLSHYRSVGGFKVFSLLAMKSILCNNFAKS
jgi:hypothetical protein